VNWLLIYGNCGLPVLGVRGAAIASVLAAAVNFVIIMTVSTHHGDVLAEATRGIWKIDFRFMGEFFRKAMPIICNELFYGLAVLVINMVLGRQGAANLSALTVFRTLEGLIFAFFMGFANASSVMVGKSIGAGALEQGLRESKRFFALCPAITLLVCLLVLLLREPIIGLFGVGDDVSATIVSMLVLYVFTAPMRTANYIQVNMYRAGGETKAGMFLEVGGIWIFGVPLVCLTGLVWGAPFIIIFLMIYVEDMVKLFIEPVYLFSARWIKPVTPQGKAELEAFFAKRRRKKLVKKA